MPGAAPRTGSPFPGTIGATPGYGWGHYGANAPNTPSYNSGGGGGAGGNATGGGASFSPGGVGIQLPSTFRDPASTVGAPGPTSPSVTGADTSGKYYVAGGGGGAAGHPQPSPGTAPKGGDGGAGGGGDGGGQDPNGQGYTGNGSNALENTGSGGGGGPVGDTSSAGGGGSGLVLIAYPT